MNHCESYEPLLDAFTEGDLFLEDMVRVQQHLNNCPDCQAYIEDLLAIQTAFPTVEETKVPAGFAAGVMAAVAAIPQASAPAETSAPKPVKRKTPWVKILSGLAACCAIVVLAQGGIGMGGGNAAPKEETASEAIYYTAADGMAPAEAPAAAEPKLAQPEEESVATTEAMPTHDAENGAGGVELSGGSEEDNSPYRIVATIGADAVGDVLRNRLPLVEYDEVVDGETVHTREYELTMAEYDELLHELADKGKTAQEEGFSTETDLVLVIVRQ